MPTDTDAHRGAVPPEHQAALRVLEWAAPRADDDPWVPNLTDERAADVRLVAEAMVKGEDEAVELAELVAGLARRVTTLRGALEALTENLSREVAANRLGPDYGWTHEDEAVETLRRHVEFAVADACAVLKGDA